MDTDIKLEPIMDEDEDEPESATTQTSLSGFPARRSSVASSFGLQRVSSGYRQGSETPSFEGNMSSSSPSVSATHSLDTPSGAASSRPDWSFLPHDLQFYLNSYSEGITHYHYCMVTDADHFFRTILPTMAVRNEALLYAVVGFAAYHHVLQNPTGQVNEFLQYYNRSVSLLLASLKKKERHNVTTLLTILQLATIEVSGRAPLGKSI